MTQTVRNVNRYSIGFKLRVVEEIEKQGLLVEEAKRRYGINGGQTIQRWIRKFGKHHLLHTVIRIETMEEKDQLKKLQAENQQLKMALADSLMEKRCLEVLIEQVDKVYKTDVKKNFGGPASGNSKTSTPS